ncbi:MAG: MFS transporter, partial [Francisellaceae bacterium]|nr:MFS transporter [Francisellaceae bacterium]
MNKVLNSPLISLVILVLGVQYFQTFITVVLDANGYTEFHIGIIHSSSYLGLLLSAIYSEGIIKRVGHIRAFTLFSSVVASTILLQSYIINYPVWVISRFFSGYALAGLYITIESWILLDSKVEDRGKRLAYYMFALYFSQSVSSQIFHIIDSNSVAPYITAALLCILSNIPMTLTHTQSPSLPEFAKLKIIEVYRVGPFGFIGCLSSGIILSTIYCFIPKYAVEYDMSVAWTMTTMITGGFILQWPLGKLSDAIERDKVLLIISLLGSLVSISIIFCTSELIRYILLFLLGGLSFSIYPISIASTCDIIKNRCIVQVTGVLLFSYGLGSVIGPILSSAVIDKLNSSLAMFGFISAAMSPIIIMGSYKWFRGQDTVDIDNDNVAHCIPMPSQTQIANQLDPRVELDAEKGDLLTAIESEDIIIKAE